jgi:16S rRNA (cytidine1402-2'-O)-methyltransferase
MMGFPPRKAGPLRKWVYRGLASEQTLVILESARRGERLIRVLSELAPEREAVICRELTKVHEEIRRAPLRVLSLDSDRGELVLVVGPGEAPAVEESAAASGTGLKAVTATLATRWGCTRREAYRRLLELESVEDA